MLAPLRILANLGTRRLELAEFARNRILSLSTLRFDSLQKIFRVARSPVIFLKNKKTFTAVCAIPIIVIVAPCLFTK
jgi:hypothetical protein